MVKVMNQVIEDEYAIYRGDCVEVMAGIPDDTIDYSIYSPPFAELYSYSDSERDMGNNASYQEFFKQYDFLISEHFRTMRPGRLVSIHCVDIPAMKERDGYIGIKDFPGDIIKSFQKAGFIYHSRHVIWKDPLIEATRTKSIGLMHKQLCKDSHKCRAGLPDYIVTFRKPGDNTKPICNPDGLTEYHGSSKITGDGIKRSHNIWRAYASPIWMDIRQSNTLNKNPARHDKDQKHICPLQLDVIERCIQLWSTKEDTILTPFMGIGSEVYVAVKNKRKAIGIELKDTYFACAVKNAKKGVSDMNNDGQTTLM